MRGKLQTAVDVVLAISAAAVAVVVVLKYLGVARSGSPDVPYKVGDSAPAISGVDFSTRDKTLLLVLRSTCHFCTESMPFYQRLIHMKGEGRAQFVAASSENGDAFRQYLHRNELGVDQAAKLDSEALRRLPTPTLMLVDRSGRISGFWVGQLSASEERILADAVCPSCQSQ